MIFNLSSETMKDVIGYLLQLVNKNSVILIFLITWIFLINMPRLS